MNIAAAATQSVALSSTLPPERENNQSVADKAKERDEAAGARSEAGKSRGIRIDIQA
jgi:hypothetical protein